MGGRLESASEDSVWKDIAPPAFIAEIPKDSWSDEQKKMAADHDKAVLELTDARDKRRKALDAEMRKLQENIKGSCDAFDARLDALFHTKLDTEQRIIRDELRLLQLAKALQQDGLLRTREAKLLRDAHGHRGEAEVTIEQAADAQAVLAEIQAEYDGLVAADKAMEKAFKQRREFGDQDAGVVEQLFRLFRRRPKRIVSGTDAVTIPPLDRGTDCPEGASAKAWETTVVLREEKLQMEANVRVQAANLADMTAYVKRCTEAAEQARSLSSNVLDELTLVQTMRSEAIVDASILIVLKHGQVEVVHPNEFDPEFQDAILVHRSVVEDLNAILRKLGAAKVDHLRRRMELRKGIHMLEWELRRLQMCVHFQ